MLDDYSTAAICREFGQVLRSLRMNENLSQEALAHLSDCHRTYVGMLERGLKNPSLDMLMRLSRALSTRPSDMLRMLEESLERTSPLEKPGKGGESSENSTSRTTDR